MGVLTTAKDVSLSCHVECFPLCEIVWLKNGLPIGESELYSIKTSTLPPDQTKSDFESVLSTLIWNLTAWPNGQLDRMHDNANYTCQSTSNSVGAGVSSTTHFHVECKFFGQATTLDRIRTQSLCSFMKTRRKFLPFYTYFHYYCVFPLNISGFTISLALFTSLIADWISCMFRVQE